MSEDEKIRNQFIKIQGLIRENIKTIRSLLENAANLRKISNSMETGEDKNNINETVESIESSISKLIADLDTLFESYRKVIDKIREVA